MGIAFPIACVLVALESLVIAATLAGSWMKPDGKVSEGRGRWLRSLVLTLILAAFPALLATIEIIGDLGSGIGVMRPLGLLVMVAVFPAFALLRLRAAR